MFGRIIFYITSIISIMFIGLFMLSNNVNFSLTGLICFILGLTMGRIYRYYFS